MSGIAGKTDALVEWARKCSELDGFLKLNAILTEEGERAIYTVANEHVAQRYIDGTADREMTFALRMVARWSDGFDGINADAERTAETWLDWVASQWPGNVPGIGAEVTGIEPVQNVPTLAAVYQEEGLAEYMFQAKIYYRE